MAFLTAFLTALPLYVIAFSLAYETFRWRYYVIETSYGGIIDKEYFQIPLHYDLIKYAEIIVNNYNEYIPENSKSARHKLVNIKKIH